MDITDSYHPRWEGMTIKDLAYIPENHPKTRGRSAAYPDSDVCSIMLVRDFFDSGQTLFPVDGKHIVEIGPGPHGGLADVVMRHGAADYTGIDIFEPTVARARKTGYRFVWDDPLTVLPKLQGDLLVVSMFVDDLIIDESYVNDLARTIHDVTITGGCTYHWGNYDPTRLQPPLLSLGWTVTDGRPGQLFHKK